MDTNRGSRPVGASTGMLGGGFPAWAVAARANTGEVHSPRDASDDGASLWLHVASVMPATTPAPAPPASYSLPIVLCIWLWRRGWRSPGRSYILGCMNMRNKAGGFVK
jgi:hypothetical protein